VTNLSIAALNWLRPGRMPVIRDGDGGLVLYSAGKGRPVEEQLTVTRNVALQREWYGEPLGDRVRRLVVAFAVSQAQLAEVLGLSPPMLSQLMSGRRAKIGNPAVLARMVMLERRVLTPEVASGDQAAIRAALREVRDSRPTVSCDTLPVEEHSDEVLVPGLRRLAAPAELAAAAGLLQEGFPLLAGLLRRASGADSAVDPDID
jgi:transcriptional regulator with XRE-family HTH domain